MNIWYKNVEWILHAFHLSILVVHNFSFPDCRSKTNRNQRWWRQRTILWFKIRSSKSTVHVSLENSEYDTIKNFISPWLKMRKINKHLSFKLFKCISKYPLLATCYNLIQIHTSTQFHDSKTYKLPKHYKQTNLSLLYFDIVAFEPKSLKAYKNKSERGTRL